MVKKMNNQEFIRKLEEKTNYNEEKCVIINNVLENHFIVGRKNKQKIKNDFVTQLAVTEEEANKLYNICMELIVKGIEKK